MNKKIFSGLIAAAVMSGLFMARPVMANEGVVMLKGAGVSGACFAASVFVDGTYRVLATCRDLKTALSPEQNRYVVWLTEVGGKVRRLGEIVNGKLATATDVKFTDLFVTAEADGYGNKPSDTILLSGPVQTINFDSADFKPGAVLTAEPTPTPKNNVKVTPTVTTTNGTETPNKGIGGALSTVLKIALFGFGALLLIVGVFSFISRKRAL
jgi:hypothetical protein